MPLPIVLASSSQYRKQLLSKLPISFECASPNLNEQTIPNESAADYVERLAISKALALKKTFPSHLIIGSDQCCVIDQKIIGKPGSQEKAIQQLQKASGKKITFYTGLALVDSQKNQHWSLVEPFHVFFRTLSQQQIERYVELENPIDCAGGFKSEELGICLFERLEGRDPNTLVGLPLIGLIDLFQQAGVDFLTK